MNVLDLFSGVGGFSLGLHNAGMQTIAFCEIDPTCRSVLNKHWPHTIKFQDIRDVSYLGQSLCEKGYDWITGDIDVICGGFPCQDISVAGNKKGFSDDDGNTTRSGLWFEYLRLIKEIAPSYVIIENVAQLRTHGLTEVLQGLSQIGYDTEWEIIPATAAHLPHSRERIWIIAYPRSERFHELENPTKGRNLFRHVHRYSETKEGDLWSELELWAGENGSLRQELTTSFWEAQSGILGVVDGVPSELDKPFNQRMKQLGNSIVPKIAELIGLAIMEDTREHRV